MTAKTELDLRISLVGDDFTGKSCFLYNLLNDGFDSTIQSTIGPYHKEKIIETDKYFLKVHIIDTPGLKEYRVLATDALKNSDGIIIFYDITDRLSFFSLPQWMASIKLYAGIASDNMMIVGTKCDLEDRRTIKRSIVDEFAKSYNIDAFETSSLEGLNVQECFINYIKRLTKNKLEYN